MDDPRYDFAFARSSSKLGLSMSSICCELARLNDEIKVSLKIA